MSRRTLKATVLGALVGSLVLGGAALWRTLAEGGVPDPVGLWGFTSVLGAIVGGLVGPLVGGAVRRRREADGGGRPGEDPDDQPSRSSS